MLRKVLEDAELQEMDVYALLTWALKDQSTEGEGGKLVPKDKKEIPSDRLQNPSVLNATFLKKSWKAYQGYVGNVVETVCRDGLGMITIVNYAPNTHSDSQFMKDYLTQQQEDVSPETMITDGAYGGEKNVCLAVEKGVKLEATVLTGKDSDQVMGEFELSEDGKQVLHCPMGYALEKSSYHPKAGI